MKRLVQFPIQPDLMELAEVIVHAILILLDLKDRVEFDMILLNMLPLIIRLAMEESLLSASVHISDVLEVHIPPQG